MTNVRLIFVVISIIIADISGDIPGCDYFDTVDLTNTQQLSNGSYKYEGVIIPIDKIGQYNYTILWKGKRKSATEHTRGCICPQKSCIRFCCDPLKSLDDDQTVCGEEVIYNNGLVNVTMRNGKRELVNVLEKFVVQDFGIPCQSHVALDEKGDPYDLWRLNENGLLVYKLEKTYFKNEYCMQPHKNKNGEYKIIPHVCDPEDSKRNLVYYKDVCIISMILTIILFLLLPMSKNQHHIKFYILYFTFLTLSLLLIRISDFIPSVNSTKITCCALAYVYYFALMSTFLWLLIVNYNLCTEIRSLAKRRVSFMLSTSFVFTVAGVLTLIAWIIDQYTWPKFCTINCGIHVKTFMNKIFIYAPVSIIMSLNLILFILTVRYIHEMCIALKSMGLHPQVNFKTYVTYFLISGVIWIFDILSTFMPAEYIWIEAIGPTQGIIVLFLMLNSTYRRFTHSQKSSMESHECNLPGNMTV